MDRERLERYLSDGLSLEAIGALEGKHPSTVGYWLKRLGLEPSHPEHGRRMELGEQRLRALADEGLTLAEIAEILDVSQSTVKRRLGGLGITRRSASRKQLALATRERGETCFTATCRFHGEAKFHAFPDGKSRCASCNSEAVSRCRRKRKEVLAEEAGGRCRRCGYHEFLAALQFHHRDPKEKEFGLAEAGVTRSLEKCRAEAKKCILLCANCHSAFEAGLIDLPVELWDPPDPE